MVEEGYTVQVGAFSKKSNAERLAKRIEMMGYDSYLDQKGTLIKVQTEVYETRKAAENEAKKLRRAGIAAFVVKTSRVTTDVPQEEVQKPVEVKPVMDIDKIVKEVISGRWGNGSKRRDLLESAGYSYREVQDRINKMLLN